MFSREHRKNALPVTQTQPSMPAYLQGWHATNATTPPPGALPASACCIQAVVVKMPVLLTKGQPAVIATPATFPRLHASTATTATILARVREVAVIELLNS
jgi:hypothetical protein